MPPDLAAIGRIYEGELSDGDRSCLRALIADPAAVQATSAGTGHCRLHEHLAAIGWAAQDPPSDLTRAAPSLCVWRLTDAGRARLPAMLAALTVDHQVRALQASRARQLSTFGALLIGVTLGLYAAVFLGIGALLSGRALKLMDPLAALVLMAVLTAALWLAVAGWAERPVKGQVKGQVLSVLGRLAFLKANRSAVAAAMAVALVLIGLIRLWLRHATGVDLPAPILLSVQAGLHAVLGFAVGWYVGPMIIDARTGRPFPARR